MNYFDIEERYKLAGCEDFKLKDAMDLKKILNIDLEDAKYFNELSNEHKIMTLDFVLAYLNSYGLESREGYRVSKVYLCQKQELLTEKDEDGIRTVVGSKFLNFNDNNNIKLENISLPGDYEKIKDSLIWEIEKGYFGDVFLRVDLVDSESREKWFHVYTENGEIQFY